MIRVVAPPTDAPYLTGRIGFVRESRPASTYINIEVPGCKPPYRNEYWLLLDDEIRAISPLELLAHQGEDDDGEELPAGRLALQDDGGA